ncbi:MAG: S8 family serine peptidase [Burkholderiaceae bacterium]|nr:S8 family serine peptidase [Aquabacterium sp.]NUP84389.1 S8 family serine peptidase [Burkholderiaceae bacterium]
MSKSKTLIASACAALGLAGAMLAVPMAAQAQDGQRVRMIVAYKDGQGAAMRAAVARLGGKVVVDLDEVNAFAVVLPRRAVAVLQRAKGLDFAEEDSVRKAFAAGRTRVAAAAGGQVVPYGIPMVQADQVSDATASARKLCIVDSGIDGAHEDLVGIPMDGANHTASGSWNTDENSHGTHVAGTVAAVNNTVGVIGVMPNKQISLYISKVFDAAGTASTSTIIKGMLACNRAGANVVSMSLGGSKASKLEEKVVNFMTGRNILIIAAAGNAGTTAVSYPAGFANVMSVAAVDSSAAWASFSQYNPDVEIAAPGVAVLSTVPAGAGSEATTDVGGTAYPVIGMAGSPMLSASGALADFGTGEVPSDMTGKVCLIQRGNISFSDKVLNCQNSGGVAAIIYNNVAGPLNGTLGDVVTTIPSVGASDTDGASMLTKLGQTASVAVTPTSYALFNGTSMATPHASAVAALVWSRHTNCTAAQIRDSLNKSAMDLGPAGRDDKFGYGLVQAKAADDRIDSLGCGN